MLETCPRRPFRRARKGQTMIEIAVATMIAAITTVAVFSVILSSFVSQKKADKKELIAMLLKNAHQTLQTYVSADVSTSDACGGYCAPSAGGLWSADSSGAWALAARRHDISSLMNGTALQVDPTVPCVDGGACWFVYTVTNQDCLNEPGGVTSTDLKSCKTVVFELKHAD